MIILSFGIISVNRAAHLTGNPSSAASGWQLVRTEVHTDGTAGSHVERLCLFAGSWQPQAEVRQGKYGLRESGCLVPQG